LIDRAPDHFFGSADLLDPSFSHNGQTVSGGDGVIEAARNSGMRNCPMFTGL
jgi:hypothetical protein